MADKGLMKVYSELPSWAKGVVVVGGLTVTYLAVTSVLRKLKEAKNKKESLSEINASSSELQDEINKGKRPTLPKTTLEAMANAIVSASNDCGTDEKKIYAQFDKVANQADILSLVQTFGLRKKVRCPFSDDPRESFFSADTPPMSLSSMLNSELDTTQMQTLNNKLASKGINYKF
jgi:hypothetical protein